MANSVFNLLGNGMSNNPMMATIQRFNQFKQQFQGDPQQKIQQMLNSGQITQEQYNNAVQQANALKNLFKI